MKKIVFTSLIFLSLAVYAQEELVWDYPVKPGTEEWKKLSANERKAACQIPDDILQIIPTNQLTALCARYPYLGDVAFYDNLQLGVERLIIGFNGIRELSKRDATAVNYLREQYLSDVHSYPDKSNTVSGVDLLTFAYRISVLELLLSYSAFHINTTKEDQKKILESLLFGYRTKCQYPTYFEGFGFRANLLARANLLITIDPSLSETFGEEKYRVLSTGKAISAGLIDTMDALSYKLIR